MKIWKNQKKYCENLYEEYEELEARTSLIYNKRSNKKEEIKYIKREDLNRIKQIQKELIKNCKHYLKLEDKIEIEKALKK